LSTAGYFLEEASPHDSFWGIGKFGNGTNVLGKVLEEERETLLLNEVCA
jgi:diaminohydroxyphosphoribosylaminopyrimidine deaminase/5-amino-6-(5-phosphoribosylamino)uracil reductase